MTEPDTQGTQPASRFGAGRALVARGIWAVADQGLFALSNFAIHLALARWMAPAEYGAFAMAFTAFLLLGSVHGSLFTEPMLVFGAGRYRDRFSAYLGLLLRGHWALSGGIFMAASAALAWLLLAMPGGTLPATFVAAALASPFILNLWLLRRACYISGPQGAAIGGTIYLVLVLPGVYLLHEWDALSSAMGFAMMAGASLLSAVALFLWLRPKIAATGDLPRHEVVATHWRYGRWAAPTAVLFAFPGSLYYFVLPAMHGLEEAGALRALINLTLPVFHALGAICSALLPALVQARNTKRFDRYLRVSGGLFVAIVAVYSSLLLLFQEEVFVWIYGGNYAGYSDLIWPLALFLLVGAVLGLLSSALRALERPDLVFWGYVAATAISATAGLLLVYRLGVEGALWAVVSADFGAVLVICFCLFTKRGRQRPRHDRDPTTR